MGSSNLTGTLITAEDVAHVIAFLASPKSRAINGDVIAAGGGIPGAIHY
jgi:enoyl-[acyl-carrier-protein] reductase (NADH)